MRYKVVTASILAATLSAFTIAGAAQRSQKDPQDQTTQDQSKPRATGQGMMGDGMMMGMMMGMSMGQIAAHHEEMTETMNKLMQSMAAIRNEKDPEALKSKLAEHQALLDRMRSQMMQQGNRMHMMSGNIKSNCPMAGDVSKPPTQ